MVIVLLLLLGWGAIVVSLLVRRSRGGGLGAPSAATRRVGVSEPVADLPGPDALAWTALDDHQLSRYLSQTDS